MKRGFTLVELLVVIGIIAILSAALVGSMNVMRERGQAAKIVGDVRLVRDALQFRYSTATQYPTEEELVTAYPTLASSTMTINNMITAGVFEGKFTSAPVANVGTGVYAYDADAGDGSTLYPIDDCGNYTNNDYGVNLVLENAIATNPDVVTELDTLVDEGDGLDCGRIRRVNGTDNSVLYNLTLTPTLFP